MVYMRPRSESAVRQFSRIEIPENKLQYCCPESDSRIRALIRGMDDRERLVVLDEIGKIYQKRKDTTQS